MLPVLAEAAKVLAAVPSLDIAYLLNVTNSARVNSKEVMAVKEELIAFTESLFRSHPKRAVRISFVTCDDFCPAFYHAEFVSSPDLLVAKVRSTHCMPVLSALHTLSSLDWRAELRLLFHVDYNAYKLDDIFHEDQDDFVVVEQRPLIIAQLLSDLERKGISYHFIPMAS